MPVGSRNSDLEDGKRFRDSAAATFVFIAALWIIKSLEYYFDVDLGTLGIYPRTLEGSLGIFTGPLVHGDFFHLISNTFPIAILGIGVIYFYRPVAIFIIGLIYFISGFCVWLIARDAYHIGASGIVYGLMFFLLVSGFLRGDRRQLAISFVILLLYGGSMFSGLVPTDTSVSWEAHGMGALAGIFCAILFRKTTVPLVREPDTLDSSSDDEELPLSHTGESDFYYKIKYKDEKDLKG